MVDLSIVFLYVYRRVSLYMLFFTNIYIYNWLVASNISVSTIYGIICQPLTNSYFSRWFANHQADFFHLPPSKHTKSYGKIHHAING